MKILILSDSFPPYCTGGAGQIAAQLAEGYANAGHMVEIFANPEITYRKSLRPYLSLRNPKASKLVSQFFKEHGPFDVVHAHNVHQFLTYNALRIAKKHAKKVVITFHDVMSVSYGRLATQKYLDHTDYKLSFVDHIKQAGITWNPLRNLLIKRALKNVDAKIAVSNALKEVLETNGIGIDHMIHNGIDADHLPTKALKLHYFLENKPVIFFGGRLSGDKGLSQLFDAFLKIQNTHPTAVILIAGDESRIEKLLGDYRREETLKAAIVTTGKLEHSEFLAAMALSNICVTPSVCFDSFPTVNLEAMTLGKPVIATHYGGSKELVQDGETGFIINPFDTKTFAEKLDLLLSDPDKAIAMGKAGKKHIIENFSLEQQVEQYLQIFDFCEQT